MYNHSEPNEYCLLESLETQAVGIAIGRRISLSKIRFFYFSLTLLVVMYAFLRSSMGSTLPWYFDDINKCIYIFRLLDV